MTNWWCLSSSSSSSPSSSRSLLLQLFRSYFIHCRVCLYQRWQYNELTAPADHLEQSCLLAASSPRWRIFLISSAWIMPMFPEVQKLRVESWHRWHLVMPCAWNAWVSDDKPFQMGILGFQTAQPPVQPPQNWYVRRNPDVGQRLNQVDVTTPINIFARGGAGFLSLTEISEVCHLGCGSRSRLGRTCFRERV